MKDEDTVIGQFDMPLNKKELKKLIKKYFIITLGAKRCKVKLSATNIIDKIRCVDVFRDKNSVFYSTAYETIVTGKIKTIRGKYHTFITTRNLEETKEIIKKTLANEYNYSTSDVYIKAGYFDNKNGGFDVNILGAQCTVDQKILKKDFKKSEK